MLDGQTVGHQPVAGRVSGIAVDRTGQIVYAATAGGGVFRSDDRGASWRPLMDDFDVDPREFASSSLTCGAIAIHPDRPQRIYVGTGEGDTHHLFSERLVTALPAYRGIGPIRSDDGGKHWFREPTARGSENLAGDAFFALAVDPRNYDNVIAATTLGLYQRVSGGPTGFQWTQRAEGVHSSVVAVSSQGTTRFFAGKWGEGVFQSDDGRTWTRLGRRFPNSDVGRIALGAQPDNLDVLYAFVATKKGRMKGVYRLSSGVWRRLLNVRQVLNRQGNYDLAIAVDPKDIDRIYLGGDSLTDSPWPGSIWRCVVRQRGSTFRVKRKSIGEHTHADIHVLTHTPGDPHKLWCGCDGGVFLNKNPRRDGRFVSQNDGLACLCCNFIAQHPTDPNILFTGLQDNGTARTSAVPIWKCVAGGDGGYCLVNWAKPRRVLAFVNGRVIRSMTGGASLSASSWEVVLNLGFPPMTRPIVGAPFNEDRPGDADCVAVGADSSVHVSDDFGDSWTTIDLPLRSVEVFALAFASSDRLFVGTTKSAVFRADRSRTGWTVRRLDNATLEVDGLITDIAVDWSDPSHRSVYVVFGGMSRNGNDHRHVWRFDGATTRWESRSGHGRNALLDVEHNALVVDREHPQHLYVGADIGVWHSRSGGRAWTVMQNRLPDAPVFDLQIHPTQRLLRAALHGRGLYETPLR